MSADLTLPVGGVELGVYGRVRDAGTDVVLCLHETGATAACWADLASAGAKTGKAVIRYDRRGWGTSSAPEPYLRTTVGEQAQDALGVLDALGVKQATIVGSGIGAVAALDLALREPGRVRTVVAIEPPLLALADGATEGLSEDVAALRDAVEEAGRAAGREAATDLFLAGELPYLAPGAERLPEREALGGGDGAESRRRPASLIAELGAVAAWPLPFEALVETDVPLAIVVGSATPTPIRHSARILVDHAPTAELAEFEQPDPMIATSSLAALAI